MNKTLERFWSKVDKTTTPDGCWIWKAGLTSEGYGEIWINGRVRKAAICAWELEYKKSFPKGKMACHTCNNPSCVRPDHIYVGDNSTNMLDAVEAGTHNTVKLTWEQVKEIRSSSLSRRKLAIEYGVSISNIRHILQHNTWKCEPNKRERR